MNFEIDKQEDDSESPAIISQLHLNMDGFFSKLSAAHSSAMNIRKLFESHILREKYQDLVKEGNYY